MEAIIKYLCHHHLTEQWLMDWWTQSSQCCNEDWKWTEYEEKSSDLEKRLKMKIAFKISSTTGDFYPKIFDLKYSKLWSFFDNCKYEYEDKDLHSFCNTDTESQCMMSSNYSNTRVLMTVIMQHTHGPEPASLLQLQLLYEISAWNLFRTENGKCSLIIIVIIRNYNSPTLTEIEFEQSLISYWNI